MTDRNKKKLRTILDKIGDALLDGGIGEELAAVLSALRGPDSGDYGVKYTSTNFIRRAAFPKVAAENDAKKFDTTGVLGCWDLTIRGEKPVIRTNGGYIEGHFDGHINSAALALGLTIEKI